MLNLLVYITPSVSFISWIMSLEAAVYLLKQESNHFYFYCNYTEQLMPLLITTQIKYGEKDDSFH